MENAAKALLIAGGVMIAILLLSLFTYLFSKMANSTANIYSTLQESEIAEFNQQFLNYDKRGIRADSTPLKVQDVATLINLVQDANDNPKFPTTIEINCNGRPLDDNFITWLEEHQTSNDTYQCTVEINTTTMLVYKVNINSL